MATDDTLRSLTAAEVLELHGWLEDQGSKACDMAAIAYNQDHRVSSAIQEAKEAAFGDALAKLREIAARPVLGVARRR